MNARTCIIVIATIIISVELADAQSPTKVPRIGFLSPESHQSGRFEAFRQGLRELGYVEGKNITIEHRSSEDNAQLERLATELVREKVAVLVTQGRATVQAKNIAANVRNRGVSCPTRRTLPSSTVAPRYTSIRF